MPKFYCDYCDIYLTSGKPNVRKTHCNGNKHRENVKLYYQKWMDDQVQALIDATTAAFMKGHGNKGLGFRCLVTLLETLPNSTPQRGGRQGQPQGQHGHLRQVHLPQRPGRRAAELTGR